jgi:hypothetical protein
MGIDSAREQVTACGIDFPVSCYLQSSVDHGDGFAFDINIGPAVIGNSDDGIIPD